MATLGDDLGRMSGTAAEAGAGSGGRRGAADGAPTDLPAPVLPSRTLPPPVVPPPTFASPVTATPDRAGAPSPAATASSFVAGPAGVAPNSFTDIRAVHEATTQQLRERRSNEGGRAVAVACVVVVFGGIAFVLASLLV